MPISLKFDGFEGEAVDGKLHHDFNALGNAFDSVGDDFVKLIDDLSSGHGESFYKIAHDIQINHDLHKIDDAFLKISDAFLKLDPEFVKFGDGITNLVENDLKITPLSSDDGDGSSSVLADAFHKIDTDLHTTGTDFIKVNEGTSSGEVNETFLKVGEDFVKIDGDLQNLGEHFGALGADFIKIGEMSDSQVVDQVFLKVGADLLKVGENFSAVSSDFLKIGLDFIKLGDSDVIKLDQSFLKFADDFLKLNGDALKLNSSLHTLGQDFLKMDEVLHKFDVTIIPTPEDQTVTHTAADHLHQVLHAVSDFMLI